MSTDKKGEDEVKGTTTCSTHRISEKLQTLSMQYQNRAVLSVLRASSSSSSSVEEVHSREEFSLMVRKPDEREGMHRIL